MNDCYNINISLSNEDRVNLCKIFTSFGIIPENFTGKLVLEANFNKGGISKLDRSIKNKIC